MVSQIHTYDYYYTLGRQAQYASKEPQVIEQKPSARKESKIYMLKQPVHHLDTVHCNHHI